MIKGKLMPSMLDFIFKYKKFILSAIYLIFLGLVLITLANTFLGMKWFDFESILASPKSSYATSTFIGSLGANFYSMVFGIIPLALFSMIFLLLKNLRNDKINNNQQISFYLFIFILLYYFASAVNHVSATVRYQIIIYPVALIIAAIGIAELMKFEKLKKIPQFVFFALILIFSLYSLNFIKPFYFCYANGLLPKNYVLNLKDMGDGSYEAAQYLNSLPGSENLRVWTDKRGVCTFFKGGCSSSIDKTKNGEYFDYFVVSSGRENRTSKMTLSRVNGGNDQIIRLDKLYQMEGSDLEWKLEIGKRPNNFVKIIEMEKIKD